MAFDAAHTDILLNLPAHLSGLETLEALVDHPALNAAFKAGIRREITRAGAARREAQRTGGVCQSGLGADPYRVASLAEIEAEAKAADERAKSPRGIFLSALTGVEQVPGHEYDAERLRALFNRDLADDRRPLNVKAVGAALAILNGVPGKDARRAIDALSELLLQVRAPTASAILAAE